ncbi:hypothetical protein EC991_002221 [Linnemannia zychae]|nr:hypothetical protein EC991_002221 [Linnemannia zychae]
MLENINSEILLNDKGKACLCPVADLVTKPETLAACAGNTPYCSANFLNFTADIFSYIGKNNNCSTYGHAAVTSLPPATKESGANGFVSSNMMVVLGTAAVMTAASVLL